MVLLYSAEAPHKIFTLVSAKDCSGILSITPEYVKLSFKDGTTAKITFSAKVLWK